MLDITTPPPPVPILLLTNLLGYKGLTIVKPVLCLESGQWAWDLNDFRQELHCLVEVPPLLSSPYKSPEPPVTSGEAGWTAGSMHLHHALGASQGGFLCLLCFTCFPVFHVFCNLCECRFDCFIYNIMVYEEHRILFY